ncbi:MAG: nucleoside-diphosphate-sugar epimerase [Phenylobacterium sp.]|nr:nucleoside-diphosphate-sugar epimerase [Phenylobacterium sp.]
MHVFILGATGFLGGAIGRRLMASGHQVSGMARSAAAAAGLRSVGITPVLGDLESDLDAAVDAGLGAEAVIFAPQLLLEPEHRAVSGFLDALAGTGKTFVFTSGTGVLGQRTGGDWSADSFAEDDPFTPAKSIARRVETEDLVRAAVRRDVRGIVVRPPLIWGPGDHGHVAFVYESVARTGAACYVGRGLNCYTNVHIDDLSSLYELVLEKGTPGALYHAVAGEIPNRWIAEAVARDLGCETRSLTLEESFEVWGKFRTLIVMGASSRSRSPRSRSELGWAPRHLDLLAQIGEPRLRALAERKTEPAA